MADKCEAFDTPKLDLEQFEKIYDALDKKVTERLNDDYDCKKINGATLAATWAAMMSPAVGQILNSLVALETKETDADRLVKCANARLIDAQELKVDEETRGVRYNNDFILPEQKDKLEQEVTGLKFNNEHILPEQESKLIQEVVGLTFNNEHILPEQETKLQEEIDLLEHQDTEMTLESARKDCMATADCGLKDAQKDKVAYEKDHILPEQKNLTVRQTAGFDDNLRQKLFEAQMNAWAMMFSSGLLEEMPCFIQSDEASNLYNGIITRTMPPVFTPPPGGCKSSATTSSTTTP